MSDAGSGGQSGEKPILSDDERLAMETLAAINGQIVRIREAGRIPEAIVVPLETYRSVQRFRARLGDADNDAFEYLGKYDLFGLPILTDQTNKITIRTREKTQG